MEADNRNAFAHVSHTFTHEEMNNATTRDATLEIQFNRAFFEVTGIDQSPWYAPNSLIPPAITGLHNGDVIQAWMDNGIQYVVGDNTRDGVINSNPNDNLRNSESEFYGLYTTASYNGRDGLFIIPRWATTIYYNCHSAECTFEEWKATSGGVGDFETLIEDARLTNTRELLSLFTDPYMFHQANLVIQKDGMPLDNAMGFWSAGDKLSLTQAWVENIAMEMTRLTNWPILSLSQDAVAQVFLDRESRDNCAPNLVYNYNDDGTQIVSATLSTSGNSCSVSVPVTVPGTATVSGGSATSDKTGSEPLILEVMMQGSEATISLGEGITV